MLYPAEAFFGHTLQKVSCRQADKHQLQGQQDHYAVIPLAQADRRKADIVMIGNPGTRKTHLSIALGLKACVHGYSVRFFTAAGLVTKLAEAQDEKRLGRMLKELSRVNLLIVDELSYISLPRQGAELLFQVISERSERGA